VRKDHRRIEVIGNVDEANAALGVVRAELARNGAAADGMDQTLATIQHRLFDVGAELAAADGASGGTATLSSADVAELEATIDRFEDELEPLRVFILPGGGPAAAQLHLARCICRRAERRLVTLAIVEPVRDELLRYLNRLSDLLFVLARAANRAGGVPDVVWEKADGTRGKAEGGGGKAGGGRKETD